MRTLGRYAFTAPGTPHYPGEHYLGSLNWVTTDRDGANPSRGEWQRDARASGRPWHNGSFGGALPLPLVIGSRECLAQGETYPAPISGRILIRGVSSRCWQHNPEPCGAGELAGGRILQYLPSTTTATELDGGGALEDADTVGATELDGGGAVDQVVLPVGATELDGGGEQRDERGAVELDGGGAVEPSPEDCGATELDGGGETEPSETGATELDGGGVVELVAEDCGATELDGGGATEGEDYFGCSFCPLGTWQNWELDIAGATGDFAGLNGHWEIFAVAGCAWGEIVAPPGATAIMSFFFGPGAGITLSHAGAYAFWDGPLICEGPLVLPFTSQFGAGTVPASVTITPIP